MRGHVVARMLGSLVEVHQLGSFPAQCTQAVNQRLVHPRIGRWEPSHLVTVALPIDTRCPPTCMSIGLAVNTTARSPSPQHDQQPPIIWFDQTTDPGRMALGLPVGDFAAGDTPEAPTDAVTHALLLALADPLLTALEDWWHTPLDPAPRALSATVIDAPDLQLQVVDANLAPVGTRLVLPTPPVSAAPTQLCHPQVIWPPIECEVDIDCLPLDLLGALRPGGLVLLPRSLQQPWRVQVRSLSGGVKAQATFEPRSTSVRLATCASPHAGGHTNAVSGPPGCTSAMPVRITLEPRVQWPQDMLQGWCPPEHCTPGLVPHLTASLWLDTHRCARGRLIPAGQGYGLWLKEVSLPRVAIDILLEEV